MRKPPSFLSLQVGMLVFKTTQYHNVITIANFLLIHHAKWANGSAEEKYGIEDLNWHNKEFAWDPNFWKYRPLSELFIRAATDDVRFLLYIYEKMVVNMNEKTLCYLAVHGGLHCRCFCISDDNYADWPPLPPIPESIVTNEGLEEEILSVVDLPPGKMGFIIGKKGASILAIKQEYDAEIFMEVRRDHQTRCL